MLFKLSLKIIIGFLLAYQILAYPSTKVFLNKLWYGYNKNNSLCIGCCTQTIQTRRESWVSSFRIENQSYYTVEFVSSRSVWRRYAFSWFVSSNNKIVFYFFLKIIMWTSVVFYVVEIQSHGQMALFHTKYDLTMVCYSIDDKF